MNRTSIFYAQFGEGPPVLLLHGGLANSNYWGHQVKELAQKYTVTVMDTRGHGRSPVTSYFFSYGLFADEWGVCLILFSKSIKQQLSVGATVLSLDFNSR